MAAVQNLYSSVNNYNYNLEQFDDYHDNHINFITITYQP